MKHYAIIILCAVLAYFGYTAVSNPKVQSQVKSAVSSAEYVIDSAASSISDTFNTIRDTCKNLVAG